MRELNIILIFFAPPPPPGFIKNAHNLASIGVADLLTGLVRKLAAFEGIFGGVQHNFNNT